MTLSPASDLKTRQTVWVRRDGTTLFAWQWAALGRQKRL
jgi:hypothetical protein